MLRTAKNHHLEITQRVVFRESLQVCGLALLVISTIIFMFDVDRQLFQVFDSPDFVQKSDSSPDYATVELVDPQVRGG